MSPVFHLTSMPELRLKPAPRTNFQDGTTKPLSKSVSLHSSKPMLAPSKSLGNHNARPAGTFGSKSNGIWDSRPRVYVDRLARLSALASFATTWRCVYIQSLSAAASGLALTVWVGSIGIYHRLSVLSECTVSGVED